MYGFNIECSKYIEDEVIEKDCVCFTINVHEQGVDKSNVIDAGLLIGIIDTFSSFASVYLFKEEELQSKISVSLNLKVTSFEDMYVNEKYKMKVFLKYHIDKTIFYEIQILNKNNKLIKYATHLKKIINAKF
jgi:hypothetical protein